MDERFFDSYSRIKKISPIANLPPIREVERIDYEGGTLYWVIYELEDKADVKLGFTVSSDEPVEERIISITLDNETVA